jgi:hypothetical protein
MPAIKPHRRRPKPSREGWTSYGKGKHRLDKHVSGWLVRHCGHPTAHWPWTAESPTGERACAAHGHGWRTLAEAHEHVEDLVAGKRVLSYKFESWGGGRLFGRAVLADGSASYGA